MEAPPEAGLPRGPSRERAERELSDDVPGLVRMGDATSGQKFAYNFNRVVWRILQFWKRPPDLGRVRYFYIGRSLDVAIHNDGSYDVRDKRGLMLGVAAVRSFKPPGAELSTEVDEERGKNPEGAPAKPVGVGIGFREPERALQRIFPGKERSNAELDAFLKATRLLREHLMDRALGAASGRMSEVLRSIWQVPGSSQRKREDTFALWEQCSEDEIGARARRQIEIYIHDLALRRGECPYAPVDLARLNQKRRSKAPFSPCDGPDAHGVETEAAGADGGAPDAHVAGDGGVDGP